MKAIVKSVLFLMVAAAAVSCGSSAPKAEAVDSTAVVVEETVVVDSVAVVADSTAVAADSTATK